VVGKAIKLDDHAPLTPEEVNLRPGASHCINELIEAKQRLEFRVSAKYLSEALLGHAQGVGSAQYRIEPRPLVGQALPRLSTILVVRHLAGVVDNSVERRHARGQFGEQRDHGNARMARDPFETGIDPISDISSKCDQLV
jgi:hypothetical protein